MVVISANDVEEGTEKTGASTDDGCQCVAQSRSDGRTS